MTTRKNQTPKQVALSTQEVDELKGRIQNKTLTNQDAELLLGLISFNVWVKEQLERSKLSIKRLRKLFGFKNESRKNTDEADKDETDKSNDSDDKSDSKNRDENDVPACEPPDEATGQSSPMVTVPEWDAEQNHGRYGANDYTGCPVTSISFDDELLKAGVCPKCAECNTNAKLTYPDPTVLVFLESQPLVSGQRYELENGRCLTCQTYYTAPLPEELKNRKKYSHSCTSAIAINHYYVGLPFKRIEMLQRAQGVPLADATQYDLVNKFYTSTLKPVVVALTQLAANGNSLFFDDTPGRILEQMSHNKKATCRKNKNSVHSTALLSEHENHRIYLFNTNTLTAGKQLAEILKGRTSKDNFKTMSDASANNFPTLGDNLLARWIISLCLAHGRRRFVELLGETDKDIEFVLDTIAKIYKNEKHCKQHKFNDEERLIYHKKHSAPVISALHIWFNNLLLHKKVEPNSRFGEAIRYMLKRWRWLTQFLRVPGAAIDNNICEQAIKVVIRYRKNSLFYKTFYGASIGDAMMSVLHTAVNAKANIFAYFNALQQHTKQVQTSPENWLPWNYQQTQASLEVEMQTVLTPA